MNYGEHLCLKLNLRYIFNVKENIGKYSIIKLNSIDANPPSTLALRILKFRVSKKKSQHVWQAVG